MRDLDSSTVEDAQEFFKVLVQADVIKEGCARLKIHEQVKISVWGCLSPSDRANHRDLISPALRREETLP